MINRLAMFLDFLSHFKKNALRIREVIVSLLTLIAVGGWVMSRLEGIRIGEGLYFAFITALSIGYGDITPKTTGGMILSVAIGLVGMLFVGITVAIATRALADTGRDIERQQTG